MNTQTHRLIFNKSRGCLMAVGENARSVGGGVSGARRSRRRCSAGVSFANNGGDIGKTLKDMGSSQNVKGMLTAMATAGVLNAMGSTPTATGQTGANAQAISTTQAVDKFTANLMKNVTNNLASAVVSSAINGKPLNEDTLSTVLSSALITAGMAQAANNIGAATQSGALNAYTQARGCPEFCVNGASVMNTQNHRLIFNKSRGCLWRLEKTLAASAVMFLVLGVAGVVAVQA